MGNEILQKFGRYFLLDRLAQGGMAEIFRARLASADGATRILAIKRIRASEAQNVEFLQMFKAEVKLTMALNHPNIVQLYDYGIEQGCPFIAMELIDGKSLKQTSNKLAELKTPFPLDVAAHIVEQMAAGLHYAHLFVDPITGQKLNIIHRDISPHNVVLSYNGFVKIIDFGIAKAVNNDATKTGLLKGKISYMSPEQVVGEELDARSDVFALGVVLWELLVGRKLFEVGTNEYSTLRMIASCDQHIRSPMSEVPNIPEELNKAVMKALAQDRSKRFQTADEFRAELKKFLQTYSPNFGPASLAKFMTKLFERDTVTNRAVLQTMNQKAEQILKAEAQRASQSNPAVEGPRPPSGLPGIPKAPGVTGSRPRIAPIEPPKKSFPLKSLAAGVAAFAITGWATKQYIDYKTVQEPHLERAPATQVSARNPDRIEGLELWLKADSLTDKKTGDKVLSWKDSSPGGKWVSARKESEAPVFQANGIDNRPSVIFDGQNDFLEANWLADDLRTLNVPGITILYVGRYANPVRAQYILGCYTEDYEGDVIRLGIDRGRKYCLKSEVRGHLLYPASADLKAPLQVSAIFTQDKAILYSGGKWLKEWASLTRFPLTHACVIGQDWDGINKPSDFLEGELSELIVFRRALGDDERAAVEAYLRSKYHLKREP